MKFAPLIVTVEAIGPLIGLTELIVGAEVTVKSDA